MRTNHSAIQRIQVGFVGLLVVMLFVTLANMVFDRMTGSSRTADKAGATPQAPVAGATAPTQDEPLAELGVTPTVSNEPEAGTATGQPKMDGAGQQP
jgi:hypothetical protein